MGVDNIFFASTGLTSTSANHVANLAKEYVQDIEFKLNSIELIDSDVTLIGSSERNVLKTGWNTIDIQGIEQMLIYVANAKSLIAWLREAIKARQSMLYNVNAMTLVDWAEMFGIEMIHAPKIRKILTKDDITNPHIPINIGKINNKIFLIIAPTKVPFIATSAIFIACK